MTSRHPAWRRPRRLAAALLVVALTACSGSDGSSGPGATTTGSATGGDDPVTKAPAAPDGPAAPPERFSGPLEEFYVAPDPLPPGEPGQLIRVMDLGVAEGRQSLRVMYHSVDGAGRDRAVTGLITHPTGDAPEGGWPVVSWAHGTTGLASRCAPSRVLTQAPDLGFGEGVHVATDYIGLGPVGERHAYLSRPSEAHSVIDLVRAARLLPDVGAGPRWAAVGHSQGGHAAQAAHELAEVHAPELELVGTVSFAPAALFAQRFGGIDDIVSEIVGIMGVYGLATETDIDPDSFVTAETAEAATILDEGCLDDIIAAFLAVGVDALYETDPFTTEPGSSIMAANDVGLDAVEAPLLLVSGAEDQRVVLARVEALFDRLCDIGQVTELVIVDGATHDDIVGRRAADTEAWLAARFAGEPPTQACPDG